MSAHSSNDVQRAFYNLDLAIEDKLVKDARPALAEGLAESKRILSEELKRLRDHNEDLRKGIVDLWTDPATSNTTKVPPVGSPESSMAFMDSEMDSSSDEKKKTEVTNEDTSGAGSKKRNVLKFEDERSDKTP